MFFLFLNKADNASIFNYMQLTRGKKTGGIGHSLRIAFFMYKLQTVIKPLGNVLRGL